MTPINYSSKLNDTINQLGFDQNLTNLAKKLNSRERYIIMEAMNQIKEASPNTIKQKEIKNLIKKLEKISKNDLTLFEKTGNKINYFSSKIIESISPRHEYVKSEVLADSIYRFNRSAGEKRLPELEKLWKENLIIEAKTGVQNDEAIIKLNTEILSILKSIDNVSSGKKKSELKLNAKIQFLEADQMVRKARRNLYNTGSTDEKTIKQLLYTNLTHAYMAKITTLGHLKTKIPEMAENDADGANMLESLTSELHKTILELQELQTKKFL